MKYLFWLLDKFLKQPTVASLTTEQEIGLFSSLYDNPSFQKYLNARERYLIDKGMEDFIAGKLSSANGLAGQLLEIRNLRMRVKSAYLVVNKKRKENL